jgi:probable O-glycosylation ligase (exosortase A-associated)
VGVRAAILFGILLPCLPFCFFSPNFGVLIWSIIAFASPQWYAWGAAFTMPVAELVAIPTLLGFAIFSRGWGRLVSREAGLLVLFWTWTCITSVNAISTPLFESHAEMTLFRLQGVSKIFLMTLVTMGIVDSFARLRTLIIVIAGCFSFYVVKALPFMITSAGAYRLYGPPRSAVEDNNDLGLALNMTLPLLFFLAQTESNPKVKRIFWFLFFIVIPGIFCTYSRGALVGLVVVMGLMFMRLKQRMILFPAMAAAILIAVLFAPEQWKDRMNLTNKEATLDMSAHSRINAWTFAWNLAKDYPIAGGGFDTFQRDLFDRYAPNTKDVHGPHSIYFGVLGEHGWVGVIIYMGLVVSCFASLRKVSHRARLYGDETAGYYADMLQFSIIAFLTSGLFLGRQYFDYFFTLVACVTILKRSCFTAWNRDGQTLLGKPFLDDFEQEPEPQYAVESGN